MFYNNNNNNYYYKMSPHLITYSKLTLIRPNERVKRYVIPDSLISFELRILLELLHNMYISNIIMSPIDLILENYSIYEKEFIPNQNGPETLLHKYVMYY